tara:strand:- start:1040 stop:1294 length:255 start_codon:yes stop_codon:yes gene_type:complete
MEPSIAAVEYPKHTKIEWNILIFRFAHRSAPQEYRPWITPTHNPKQSPERSVLLTKYGDEDVSPEAFPVIATNGIQHNEKMAEK